jgi:hypothetical protein
MTMKKGHRSIPAGQLQGGQSILIHEWAHSILNLGFGETEDVPLRQRLQELLDGNLKEGRWVNTYAGSNIDEYFAELVQTWFDASSEAIPPDGVSNEVNTRAELKAYDPLGAVLIEELFGDGAWRFHCPEK